jgi:hypothetical protein
MAAHLCAIYARRATRGTEESSWAGGMGPEDMPPAWRYQDSQRPLSVLEFTMALARLGGHLNRKADGFPAG